MGRSSNPLSRSSNPLSSNSPSPKLFLVGLGPGRFDQLTLGSWELLASGRKVFTTDPAHEAVQEMMGRGIAHEIVDPAAMSNEVPGWLDQHLEVVVALPGQALADPYAAQLLQAAVDAGAEVEVPAAVGDIDTLPASDPYTSTFAAPMAIRAGQAFARLVSVMARLRAPGGCPWDAEQTHASLAIHLLEETYETLDAIERLDMPELEEELGDILLQVVFHAEIAAESSHFDIADVTEELIAKLVARHPHVFGDAVASSPGEVVANWEALKSEHKSRSNLGEGIPSTLPALLLAHKVRRRLSGAGRDQAPSAARLVELASSELDEARFGELFFEAASLAQERGVDAEAALRREALRRLEPPSEPH